MAGLVLLSFVLITISFRSSALDGVQGTAAGILRPFEVGADRVARPFRDAAGWVNGLADAKSQNAQLRRQNRAYLDTESSGDASGTPGFPTGRTL